MDRVASGFGALKELVAIIMGIAVGSIVITSGELALGIKKVQPWPERPFQPPSPLSCVVLGASLVFMAVRFYHGNVRAIDDDYSLESDGVVGPAQGLQGVEFGKPLDASAGAHIGLNGQRLAKLREWRLRAAMGGLVWVQALDFLVILIQGSTFAAFGLLMQRPNLLWGALFLLCITDLFLGATWFLATGKMVRHRYIWVVISMLTITILAGEYFFYLPYPSTMASAVFIGSIFDYIANWSLYFPSGVTGRGQVNSGLSN